MGLSTRTYKDAIGTLKTRLVGEDGNQQDAGGVVLFDVNGAQLIGQKTKAQSIPVVLPSDPDPTATTGTITAQDTASTSATGQGGQVRYSGTPTANSAVAVTVNGASAISIQIDYGNGAAGTVQIERTVDGGQTWLAVAMPLDGVTGTSLSQVTGSAVLHGAAGGVTGFRVRAVAAITGTITVRFQVGNGVRVVGAGILSPLPLGTTSRLTSAVVNASTSGNNTLIAGTASQTIRVFAIDLMMGGAVNIKFRDGASTDLSAAQPFYAGGGKVLDPFPAGDPLFVCSVANDFVLNLSAAVAVTGTIWYTKG